MKSISSLKQIKKDRDGLISDIARLREQLIGLQYILSYLNQKIQEAEKEGER